MRKLLYLDASFTLDQLRRNHLDHVLAIRFLEGFFTDVWSAHPVDIRDDAIPEVQTIGKCIWEHVGPRHYFIRGRIGRYSFLRRARSLNAAIALISFTSQMVSLVRREGIQVVRAGDPLMTGLIGLIISRLTGSKLVVRINGNHDALRQESNTCIQPSLFKWIWLEKAVERLVIPRAEAVFVPNADYANFALDKGASSESLVYTNYGNLIDPGHLIEPSKRKSIGYEEFFGEVAPLRWIGHIGRLQKVKRVEEAYASFVLLSRHVKDVGLCFVGDGPLLETIRERAREDGIQDRVVFLGNVDQSRLARGMTWFSAIVSPRTGRALAEAAFGARPIVAYNIDWQGELLESGKSGVLVPGGDIQGMADALTMLLRNQDLATKIGLEARRRAFEVLSPENQTSAEVRGYKRILTDRANER